MRNFLLILISGLGVVPGGALAADAPALDRNLALRGGLTNSRIQFEGEKRGHVAFLGGSITEMNGYRPLVCDALRKRFPQTEFTWTDAGVASTCSTTGAFRVQRDVLDRGPVDLFLVEFAVNDDQDAGHARRESLRGMEGIVRQTLRHNPHADIVFVYFVNPEMLATLQAGQTPTPIAAHETVAEHYALPSVHLAREVAEQITAGDLTWDKYGGVHPGPHGNALAAAMVDRLFDLAWKSPSVADARKTPHRLPDAPLDEGSYMRGRFLDPKTAQAGEGWKLHVPPWKELPGQSRARFLDTPLLCATAPAGDNPQAATALEFDGRAVGAYVLAGPDAGVIEASVDGGPPRCIDLYHQHSRGLHYPRTVMFFTDLPPGRHTLTLRVAADRNAQSRGHAVRILQFTAN